MEVPDVRGMRFSVIGGGRSGVAVASLLKRKGAMVFLSERSSGDQRKREAEELTRLGVETEFGGHTDRVLEADTVVISPGIPATIPVVAEAGRRSMTVVSEIEVACWFCRAPIIAVTGTNGKTTTTTLIGRILSDAGRDVTVAGNIGTAFSGVVDQVTEQSTVVLEVSSFQLDHIRDFRPSVAVVLNITPDHLDRYEGSFERYVGSKGRIFMNQRDGDTVVYNADDPGSVRCVEEYGDRRSVRLSFSASREITDGAFLRGGTLMISDNGAALPLISSKELGIRGIHNSLNAMAAALAVRGRGVSHESLRSSLKAFRGVEHRLEQVRVLDGVTFVNDSKATNVDSVWYALQSFDAPIVLLLGGRDKGNDYGRLTELVRRHVRTIIAIGESAATVVDAFTGVVPVLRAGTMQEAVSAARSAAQKGDVVLLSPACASFDWFDNYEHRGNVFKDLVRGL